MHVQTGGARAVHFEGNVEPHKLTEFVLLRDSDGSLRLERLSQNVKNLKVVRDAAKATAPELTPEAVAQLKARAARGARVTQAPRVTPAASVAVEAAPEQLSDDDNVDTAQLFGDEDEVVG
jgi:multidrug efflux pump subunit AcrB